MSTDNCLHSRHPPTSNPVVFPRTIHPMPSESSSAGVHQMPCKKGSHGAGSANVVKHSALTTSSSGAGSSTIMNLVPASELPFFDYFIFCLTDIAHVCRFRRRWHWKQPDPSYRHRRSRIDQQTRAQTWSPLQERPRSPTPAEPFHH